MQFFSGQHPGPDRFKNLGRPEFIKIWGPAFLVAVAVQSGIGLSAVDGRGLQGGRGGGGGSASASARAIIVVAGVVVVVVAVDINR